MSNLQEFPIADLSPLPNDKRGRARQRMLTKHAHLRGMIPSRLPVSEGTLASTATLKYLASKAKAKKPKAQGKSATKQKKRAKPIDLFVLCQLYEQGEATLEQVAAAIPEGVTMAQAHQWYVTEGMARDLAEVKGNR